MTLPKSEMNFAAQQGHPPRRPLPRQLTLALGVLFLAGLAVLALWHSLEPHRASQVATISSRAGLIWQVEVYGRSGRAQRVRVRPGAFARPPAAGDYELWALPQGGGKPAALGVLPYGAHAAQWPLNPTQQQALARTAQLAVTLEPRGGSPRTQPSGTEVFIVPLLPVS